MNWWNRTIDNLIYRKDREDPEKYMKGKFFIGSTFVFALLCIISVPYILVVMPAEIEKHPELFYANLVGIALIILLFIIYKKFGGRIVIANIIALFGVGGNQGIYEYGGGIYAPDNIWGVIVAAWVFLVADRISGIFWMAAGLILIWYFYYADANHFRDFKSDLEHLPSNHYFYNYFLAGVFLLIIISLYETSKRKFVKGLRDAKAEVDVQKKELEAQKQDILSSINYAKRIQYAVLPQEETIYRSIPLSFIYYKPRDIVSGDFFWFHEIDRDNYIIVCADCTGHGVPGALMTVIGSNLLSQIVIEGKTSAPSKILAELDKKIISTLKQQKEHYQVIQDGMDLSLLKVDKQKKEFIFTSAKRPAIFIRNKQMQEFKGSKNTLGGLRSGEKTFEEIKMDYEEDDMIYLFTDGITDQFGGENNKKYTIKRFRELLLGIYMLPVHEQKQKTENTITSWIGKNEQTDDITVMGIRF